MIPLFIAAWVIHSAAYFGVLKKMGRDARFAAIPVLGEYQLSKVLFASMRSFYQPVLAACVFLAARLYVGPGSTTGAVFLLAGILVYNIFIMRLAFRTSRAFQKGVPYCIFALFCPLLSMMIVGYGKSQYPGDPTFAINSAPKYVRWLLNASVFLLTIAEFAALICIVSFFSIRENPPRLLSQYIFNESVEKATGITDEGEVVKREDVMDTAAIEKAQSERTRDYYYPDHSGDESVVVMDYVIATDLESRAGMASVNIAQIMDATKAGPNMTFVMQTGAAKHLFTSGMEDGTYARYTINSGKLEKVMDLSPDTCMSESDSLADFITWAKENYPADRYMLVLWDHGGGLTSGFGYDQLNRRADGGALMPCGDIVAAVKKADVKFDLIGFDTCLLQDFDLAYSLSPYADYYLASEETESGFGWNYTLGFSELAKDPTISTEQFGTYMVSSFDPYNTKLSDEGEIDTKSTLSLVDMTYVGSAHDKVDELAERQIEAIKKDSDNYANISIAASGAYTFAGDAQIDLIDYLTRLSEMDYENAISTDQQTEDLLSAIRACIVVRNKNSASGINGIATCFPTKSIEQYGDAHEQLDILNLQSRKSMCDDYFSIMAYQKQRSKGDSFLESLEKDYTQESWYVKGFEDYDTTDTFVDIPLKDTGAGYQIELPEKAWKSIVDCQTIVYMQTEKGRMYLGSDHIGSSDENGNPMVAMDNTWPQIEGALICYSADTPRETEEGTIFSGTTRAILNGKTKIELYMETEPVAEDSDQPAFSHVIGYRDVENPFSFASKGLEKLEAGDRLTFVFDFYDNEGNLVETEKYGKTVTITSDRQLEVKDEALGTCDIQFGGMLTDVYQRTFLTELLDAHID